MRGEGGVKASLVKAKLGKSRVPYGTDLFHGAHAVFIE